MHNLDDLIQNISNDEVREIPGSLTKSQQARIEAKISAEIQSNEPTKLVLYKRKPLRKRMALVLAAVFILLLSITAIAATENEWDIAITNFMGLNDPSTLQLESGEVEIKATAYSNGLAITNITSIGDKNSAYIRMDTNYKLPANFDETKDYILPENHSLTILDNKKDVPSCYGGALTCFYEDGYLGFLLEISNCVNLNRSFVSLEFENLILYHDLHITDDSAAKEELLLEGNWNLNWKYSYKSSTKTYKMLKKIRILNNNVWITTVDVSPISIRVEGKRAPYDYAKDWLGFVREAEIGFKDGTVIKDIPFGCIGQSNTTFEYYLDLHGLNQTIIPEEIDYIIISDQKIDMK